MKRVVEKSVLCLLLILFALGSFSSVCRAAAVEGALSRFSFNRLSSVNGLPNDEVQSLLQDSMGFVWIATRAGLFRYDGYQLEVFKNDLANPARFTSNNILSLAEDRHNCLWIGTENGLNIMDLESGSIRKIIFRGPRTGNIINTIFCDHRGDMWIGTDAGLLFYGAEEHEFRSLSDSVRRNAFPAAAVKAIVEDHSGNIYVGTWARGLYRYERAKRSFRFFASFGRNVPVYALFEDSRHALWAGCWGGGLHRLENPDAAGPQRWEAFGASEGLPDAIVYRIAEDRQAQVMWVATRGGLFVLPHGEKRGVAYQGSDLAQRIPCDEVTTVMQDRSGQMWLGLLGGGILNVSTCLPFVHNVTFSSSSALHGLNAVRSLYVDTAGLVWAGVTKAGLVFYDPSAGRFSSWRDRPEFSGISSLPSVTTFLPGRNSTLYLGTYGGGIYAYRRGSRLRHWDVGTTAPYLPSGRINALYEDARGNLLAGTDRGLALCRPDGSGEELNGRFPALELGESPVYHIEPGQNNDYWVSTALCGAVHIEGDLGNPASLRAKAYYDKNGGLPVKCLQAMLLDRRGRLWAASLEYGLFLYEPAEDRFVSVNDRFGIPAERICALEEDAAGNLWFSTNLGIIRLELSDDLRRFSIRTFNVSDGLQSNFYTARVSCNRDNLLFFGYYGGFCYFDPARIGTPLVSTPTRITGIRIQGHPLAELPGKERKKVSLKTPAYTDCIELSHRQNNFSIEFANLSFSNSQKCRYAYRLEGYETEWKHTDAAHRVATYTNLPAGTYVFHLRATDLMGVWQDNTRKLTVVVRPPWWLSWWAFVLYAAVLGFIVWAVYFFLKRRAALRSSLLLGELERKKIQELNQNKLQFFTDITHDLLVPLSILSVATDELTAYMPKGLKQYDLVKSNISRLMRLLRQLLEFRKAETGNLRLQVAEDDLPRFVQKEVDSFTPLLRNKKIRFKFRAEPASFRVYFDSDKWDKLLYNLLSNVVRHNRTVETDIEIGLSYDAARGEAILTVRDHGKAISAEQQAVLFEPFDESNLHESTAYRRTGIGLYLTKELVELHHGRITVESGPDGTLFTLVFPGKRSAYPDEEIEENHSISRSESDSSFAPGVASRVEKVIESHGSVAGADAADGGKTAEKEEPARPTFSYTLLMVENDEELSGVLKRQLEPEYHVYTALHKEEALRIIEQKEIDLVLCDLMMLGEEGIALCHALKDDSKYCHIPLVLLMPKGKEEDRIVAYGLGADAYLSKPFQIDLLRACLANLFRVRERNRKDFRKKYALQWQELSYPGYDADFLRRAKDCVRRNLDNMDFDQGQFANEMICSKSTLFKKLKSLTGMNPTSFIRNARLKAACYILREQPSIRITELAEMVGFGDAKYFSVCFKKEFDLTPSEFAARCE
jgi:ligand-binding sensor domain-containing protein/signal transduction histidine kinase/CheY-like chemotaxis protein/AraC-like DNA-binding protein